jgi:hypothetical protein
LLSTLIYAQDTLVLSEVQHATCMEVDVKGHIYVADKNLTLFKYNADGHLITNVSIKTYGELTSLDCSNPFEIYAFHKDQNIIVFYDNMLNIRGEIKLNDYYLTNVACVARSFDNHIWLVDLTQYKVLKINKLGEVLIESPYFNLEPGDNLNVFKMWEYNNNVLIADSQVGVYQYDMYGMLSTTFHIQNITTATASGANLYVTSSDTLLVYSTTLRQPTEVLTSFSDETFVAATANRLLYLCGSKLISYPLAK